ncbi:MAG: hypothetical protein JO192_04430 [Candidatus Eremiobacteraeota bacterium]|nr:hypothetical protein [Candidatus Eremiobacteraeota bacterium]MBV8424538.1 hypothetical protein [Candidatus Eremiobacteraeota bacterium]MBV8722553.1 hypothetical protein [Candidatus Eremiobacteraeota bacterium]
MCAFFLIAIAVSLAACNGSGTAPNLAPPASTMANRQAVKPSKTIGGVVYTTNFDVKNGEEIKVDRDLVVFATDGVNIAGNLTIENNTISVAFFTPSFVVAGGGFVDWRHAEQAPQLNFIVSACKIVVSDNGSLNVPPGDNLELVASRPAASHCTVYFDANSQVRLDTGISGALGKSPQPGGSIEIGSVKAVTDANLLAKKYGHGARLRSYPPFYIDAFVPLHAGNGGNGADDANGAQQPGAFTWNPGGGANGGNVDIVAEHITKTEKPPAFYAGNGGNGGTIGGNNTYVNNPLNGTAASPNAQPEILHEAVGGDGGSISVKAATPSGTILAAGSGGNASMITSAPAAGDFWAGNGWSSPAPGATMMGNGASVTLALELPGEPGTGSNAGAPSPAYGQFVPVTFSGGSACASCGGITYYAGLTPGALIQGANGGNLTLLLPAKITPAALVSTYGLKILLGHFGDGGGSILTADPTLACPSPPPRGISGGNGGSLHDNGLWPAMYPPGSPTYAWGYGFDAGSGSPGRPGGSNGQNGYDDEGLQIGQVAPRNSYLCN